MLSTEELAQKKIEQYDNVLKQLKALLAGERHLLANLSNAAALLNQYLDKINWVGFYLLEGEELVLGPFQGLPACVRIPVGKGVCGTSVAKKQTIVVPDVHEFPGHITCDPASQSEIVIPLQKDGTVLGVLDIDSPYKDRFDEIDAKKLEEFAAILIRSTDWSYRISL
ncbi:MAG: GAF domain-containing protein [Caldibacillus sp.]